MEDYAPHRKTHVAERDFVLRVAEDKVRNGIGMLIVGHDCSMIYVHPFIPGQQPEPPLRARPHRGGRIQEHHGKALQQEDGEEGEWRREGGELRLVRRLKEVLRYVAS